MSTVRDDQPIKERRPSPIIIHRSPIEFVLVGPKGRDHGILARSKEARIDLIGFSASDRKRLNMSRTSPLSLVFGVLSRSLRVDDSNSRIMNAVISEPVESAQPDADARRQRYRFCWVGRCTDEERQLIQEAFDRQLPDIRQAMRRKDSEGAESALSPVILECSVAINNDMKRFGPYRDMTILYLAFMITALFFLGILYMYDYLKRR